MSEQLQNTDIGSRAEAIHAAAREAVEALAVRGIRITDDAAFDALKSLFAAVAPVARRGSATQARPIALVLAADECVDLATVAVLGSVRLHRGIDPAAAAHVHRLARGLIPALGAVSGAFPAAQLVAYAAQDRLAGRPCTTKERDNFKTRVFSRLLLEALDALDADPGLRRDVPALTSQIEAAASRGVEDPANDRWGRSWIAARRSENGVEAGAALSPEDRERWATLCRDNWTWMRASALVLTGHRDEAADDLLQAALLRGFGKGVSLADDASFRRGVAMQLRNVRAELFAGDRDSTGRTPISVDWSDRGDAEAALTYEERAFGQSSRESSRVVDRIDGALDAGPALAAAVRQAILEDARLSGETPHAAVVGELSALMRRAHRDEADVEIDALTERVALLRHLGAVAMAAGAPSPRTARGIVADVVAALSAGR